MKIELSNGKLEIDEMRFKDIKHIETIVIVEENIEKTFSTYDEKDVFEIKNNINNKESFLEWITECISNIHEIEERHNINSVKLENDKIIAIAFSKEINVDDVEENVFSVYKHNITFDIKISLDENILDKILN